MESQERMLLGPPFENWYSRDRESKYVFFGLLMNFVKTMKKVSITTGKARIPV